MVSNQLIYFTYNIRPICWLRYGCEDWFYTIHINYVRYYFQKIGPHY